MKRNVLMLVLLVLIIPGYSFAETGKPLRVQYSEGDVLFRAETDDEWLLASINTPLYEGDSLWCPVGSKVEIQLPEGSVVRLEGGSELHVLDNQDDFLHLYLATGSLYLHTAMTLSPNFLQIDADDTTVLPSENTRLRLDMLSNSQEDVSILEGSAYVEGNGSRTRVHAGDHIALEEERSELLPLNLPDNWEIWNVRRDREAVLTDNSGGYLPEELQSYADELNANGTWVRAPEYGQVWRPAVVVSANWSPYTNGRWVWRGNDYVWIPYDSWGWVPFHYGRWTLVSGLGWCWVPPNRGDVHWGPGYVGWYRSGSYIGWTPLAPGETYYGHGHYGRNSVNITNTTINTTSIVYRNRHVRGGLTVVKDSDFLKGRAVRSSAVKSSIPLSISTGSPQIKPIRETRMPVVRQIPARDLPVSVDKPATRDLRQRFPKVKAVRGHDQQLQTRSPAVPAPAAPVQESPQKMKATPGHEQRQQNRTLAVPPATPPATPPRQFSRPQVTPSTRKPDPVAAETVLHPPAASPENRNNSKRTEVPNGAGQRNVAQQPEKAQREPGQKDGKERRVWRVKTPTRNAIGTAPANDVKNEANKPGPVKVKEPKDKESKERGRKE